MLKREKGFTLIELMIVVIIIGILAAIAIPNFIAMQDRAKEGSTKANMHTFQLSAEDWGVKHSGVYATVADSVGAYAPTNFKNPFNGTAGGNGNAWMNATANAAGVTGYVGTAAGYTISGGDKHGNTLSLTLTNGS